MMIKCSNSAIDEWPLNINDARRYTDLVQGTYRKTSKTRDRFVAELHRADVRIAAAVLSLSVFSRVRITGCAAGDLPQIKTRKAAGLARIN